MREKEQWAACWGNPVDGFNFVGTFESDGDAIDWCQENIYTDSWWIIEVQSKAEFAKENESV